MLQVFRTRSTVSIQLGTSYDVNKIIAFDDMIGPDSKTVSLKILSTKGETEQNVTKCRVTKLVYDTYLQSRWTCWRNLFLVEQ